MLENNKMEQKNLTTKNAKEYTKCHKVDFHLCYLVPVFVSLVVKS